MSVIPLLVICSIIIAGGFLVAFLWAVGRGQYDDLHTPAMKIILDDRNTEQNDNNDNKRPRTS
ncbi:MAG: cbb3-type cytochrome oxidase assembly protein CcoS [Ignavibacteria bacterium]|nr:cbb3-type cytochrome oxidase assembly protein CcoS [Ignavibacteria bacterium]